MYRWQKSKRRSSRLQAVTLALVMGTAAGCATQQTADKGEEAVRHRNWDAAVYHYLEAVARDPDNVEYRINLERARQKAGQEHFQRGLALRELGRLSAAHDEIQMATQLDPTHQYAKQVLEKLDEELDILSRPDGQRTLEDMKRQAREAKVQPPMLDPKSTEPITLSFPKPKPVKEIYNAMAKAYGFNALFDPKLKDDKLSIELTEVAAKQALEIVMQAAGHFYKVLDERTIIVVEDTPQNRREYEDLVIKTFFLSNAEVKDVDKLLRSLIEARRLATNEQLNAITLRDTADKVAIAEKLITTNDKAKAEVLVDVELLLMATTSTSELGVTLSTYAYNLSLDTSAINPDAPEGSLGLDDFANISRGDWFINVPSILINLIKSSGEAQVLAQPQLRITEGEKASLHIGDKVPIPVTSFNTGNTIGGNVVPITSFQYQDIGIKIDVEPRVHHNREVTLKLTLEVSNLGETVPVGPSQEAVTIGTRTITSVIRLQSGESSLLAGLYRHDSSEGKTETPLLSSIPLIGRLFTNKNVRHQTTDLVMTMTPHIIRFPDITEEDLAPAWVGTESRISFFGSSSPRVQSGRAPRGPFDRKGAGNESRDRQRRPSRPRTESSGSTPYGVGVKPAPQPEGGSELIPRGSEKKSLGKEEDEEGGASYYEDPSQRIEFLPPDPDQAPMVVGFEPSVVSLRPDQSTVAQLVVTGGAGSYRLPIAVSYDPNRVAVEALEPATDVVLVGHQLDEDQGWLVMDLVVTQGTELPQPVAAVWFRGLAAGPCPVMLTSEGAVSSDGTTLPVALNDGALFVLTEDDPAGGS